MSDSKSEAKFAVPGKLKECFHHRAAPAPARHIVMPAPLLSGLRRPALVRAGIPDPFAALAARGHRKRKPLLGTNSGFSRQHLSELAARRWLIEGADIPVADSGLKEPAVTVDLVLQPGQSAGAAAPRNEPTTT